MLWAQDIAEQDLAAVSTVPCVEPEDGKWAVSPLGLWRSTHQCGGDCLSSGVVHGTDDQCEPRRPVERSIMDPRVVWQYGVANLSAEAAAQALRQNFGLEAAHIGLVESLPRNVGRRDTVRINQQEVSAPA